MIEDSHNPHNTQHTRLKQIQFALGKKTLSPARNVLDGISHQTRHKIDAGVASLLVGVETRLDKRVLANITKVGCGRDM